MTRLRHHGGRGDALGLRSRRAPFSTFPPEVPTSQAGPHAGARETFASSPLHSHSLLVSPAAAHSLTSRPRTSGSRISIIDISRSGLPGRPLCDRLRPSGLYGIGHLEAALSSASGALYGFLFRFSSSPPLAVKPEEYHRELWSRVARPLWWAWREVDERTGWRGRAALPSSAER